MKYFSTIYKRPDYPHQFICKGAEALGYEHTTILHEADLVLTWSPWIGGSHYNAGRYANSKGVPWIVFENGYLSSSVKTYSVGLDGYNGMGFHKNYNSPSDRWNSLAFRPTYRRTDEGYILVVGQFGHEDTRLSMPKSWPNAIVKYINRLTDRSVKFRPKPRRDKAVPTQGVFEIVSNNEPIESQIARAHFVVTWNSKATCVCAAMGVPFCVAGDYSIAKDVAWRLSELEKPERKDLTQFLYDISYAQWTAEEIATGEPIRRLIQ